MNKKIISSLIFIFILLLGAYFRLIGNNWDSGQHLHPDERFLTMVAGAMRWPNSISNYFDTANSRLNPQNIGFNFYVYGTWPVIIVKFIAEILNKADYGNLTLVGRTLSGITDLITAFFVFLIGYALTKKYSGGLFTFFLYSISALPIQLSHYFAVDPYGLLFSTIAIYLMLKNKFGVLMGLAIGLSLATKISGVMIIPVICLSYLITFIKSSKNNRIRMVIFSIILIIALYIILRVFYPYLFLPNIIPTLNQKVLANWRELTSFNDPNTYYPPGVQWINSKPLIFPLLNLIYFGLGIPLGLLCISGLFYGLLIKRTQHLILLSFMVLTIFFYQGTQFVKALRYFYLIYPILTILGGVFISDLWDLKKSRLIIIASLLICLIWPVAFISIYTHPHTRVIASEWIFSHIPYGSSVSGESWDDFMPVTLDSRRITEMYPKIEIPVTGPDSVEKSTMIKTRLSQTDFVILSSNRGYGSMTNLPERYPETTRYYSDLFTQQLGFTKVAEFISRPNIPIPNISLCIRFPFLSYGIISDSNDCTTPGITFIDDYADETWTIYDHPKVTIFKKQ
jgi:hypothetical protein